MRKQDIANTIVEQLGGRGKLVAMLGANNFGALDSGLQFKFKGSRKMNLVQIELNGKDLYDITFRKGIKIVSEHKDLYSDMLKEVFENETGLYLSLF